MRWSHPMTNALTLKGAAAAPAVITDADMERIGRYRASARSDNTRRAYQTQLDLFTKWADARAILGSLPINPMLVASWLAERADAGAAKSSLAVALAAIKSAHQAAGARFDAADPAFKEAVMGIGRTAKNEQDQAAPLRHDELTEILKAVRPGNPLEVRDAAMLACLYVFALRRSEIIGLDFQARGDGAGTLAVLADTVVLTLYTSKASQNEPVRVAIPRRDNPRAVAAIERWVEMGNIEPGSPLVRQITPKRTVGAGRMSEDGISRAVRAAVYRHHVAQGTPEAKARELSKGYSGHSGRVGFIVSAAEAGAPDSAIAKTTRHKSMEMIRRYGQQADQMRTAPHRIKGIGV
jgi:integrase